jgi:hypothetical protein
MAATWVSRGEGDVAVGDLLKVSIVRYMFSHTSCSLVCMFIVWCV